MKQYPIFITCRDRLEPLTKQIDWLERAGQERIYLVDNGSTYEPLLEFYKNTPHTILRTGLNGGHQVVWNLELQIKHAKNEYYVVTDPDIVPIEECPLDAIDYFKSILDKYPAKAKVGFGLKVDDIPDTWLHKNPIMNWENHLWKDEHLLEPGLYDCPIDTTFALYRPNDPFSVWFAIRTGAPYIARHLPWYTDTMHPTKEEIYYAQHSSGSSSWSMQQLGDWEKYGVEL